MCKGHVVVTDVYAPVVVHRVTNTENQPQKTIHKTKHDKIHTCRQNKDKLSGSYYDEIDEKQQNKSKQ